MGPPVKRRSKRWIKVSHPQVKCSMTRTLHDDDDGPSTSPARTGGANEPVPTLTTQAGMFLSATGRIAPPNSLYVIAEVGNDARDALALIASGADCGVDTANRSDGLRRSPGHDRRHTPLHAA